MKESCKNCKFFSKKDSFSGFCLNVGELNNVEFTKIKQVLGSYYCGKYDKWEKKNAN